MRRYRPASAIIYFGIDRRSFSVVDFSKGRLLAHAVYAST